MNYEFRTLEATDVFLMFQIINKIGIKEFQKVLENDDIEKAIMKFFNTNSTKTMTDTDNTDNDHTDDYGNVGRVVISSVFEIADIIFRNVPKCEKDIYQMLSNVSNLSVDEVKKLDMVTFLQMIIDFVKKDEFKDFIMVVAKLFK
jgi:hypothetical protein